LAPVDEQPGAATSSMSAESRSFVDTNLLVYAHDTTAGTKREAARAVVEDLWKTERGCISVQVLQELFVTLTRKIPRPLDVAAALTTVEDLARWTVHAPNTDDVIAAIRLHERAAISFWDAMIVQSAAELGCAVLYSEDLSAGQRFDGVLVVDPFVD
jgi:predicted nucleic acid-binding protein